MNRGQSDIKVLAVVTMLQFAMWMPVFLAFYPGIFTYDVLWQLMQGAFIKYSTHYPLLHTLWLQFFYRMVGGRWLEDYNLGIAISTLLQMLIFSICLSSIYFLLRKAQVRRSVRILWIVFVGVFPVFSLLSISATKDIAFSGFFIVLFVSVCMDIVDKERFIKKKTAQIIYICAIIGVILLRNNGIYPVIFLVLYYVVEFVRKRNSHRLTKTMIGLIMGLCISTALQYGLHAEKGSVNEALSLPYQQLACAYRDHASEMTESEIEKIKVVLPDVDLYNPAISDNVKNTGNASDNMKFFLKIYVREGFRFPKSYIKAFIKLDNGYMNPFDISVADIYETEELRGIIPTGISLETGVKRTSFIPQLETFYNHLFRDNDYENYIILRLFLTPATYTWMIVGIIVVSIIYKKRGMVLPIGFIMIYMMTLLAGPCVLWRYALPYVLCLPVLLASYCALRKR